MVLGIGENQNDEASTKSSEGPSSFDDCFESYPNVMRELKISVRPLDPSSDINEFISLFYEATDCALKPKFRILDKKSNVFTPEMHQITSNIFDVFIFYF